MQALFYMDMRGGDPEEMLDLYCRCFSPAKKAYPFFNRLVSGVLNAMDEIDATIERFSSNWKISRMSCVDRNILRIAVYELMHCKEIPFKVSINEAIDVGKKYGTEESGAFINGILDSIRNAIEAESIETEAETPINNH